MKHVLHIEYRAKSDEEMAYRMAEYSIMHSSFAENRYFNQLRVLGQLSNFKNQFDKAMESISTFFKEENDPLCYRGEVKGLEKGLKKVVKKDVRK